MPRSTGTRLSNRVPLVAGHRNVGLHHLGIALAIAVAAFGASPAGAHLSIIRQGAESRGGIEAGDRFGAALAAGDFNGDGFDDLAMGAPLEDVGAQANAGAVIVNFGSRYGVTHAGSQLLTASTIGHAGQSDARFGYALAAGDFNLDGFDDLVIGAPYEDVTGASAAGRVYIVYGSASGLQAGAIAWDQTVTGGANETGDRFGSAFAVGNFNGDGLGYPDLAIGGPGEDGDAGAVFINFFGGPLGLTNGLAGWVKQSSLGGTNAAGDQFGFALAAGNLTGTAADDLAIGAPFKSIGAPGFVESGAVWTLRGSASGITLSSPLTSNGGTVAPNQSGANHGYALAVGRFFDGAYRSLAIAEPGRNVGGLPAGRVVVVEGGVDYDWGKARILTQASGFASVPHAGERFGAALAAGDFGVPDGYDDLGIGSPGDGFGQTVDAGQFHVYPGQPNGPSGTGWSAFNQGTLNEPFEPNDDFGAAIAFGRFDEGFRGGFAVGAPGERYENPAEGAAVFPDAGQVHMILPWRQAFGLHCLRSAVFDCENSLVFSQKPFERVRIASTTKAMTLLVAAERSQLPPGDPAYVNLDVVYFTPAWVADEITGSQFNLFAGELMSIRDLLFACLYRSGNDAAYAIADACGRGATTDLRIADFVGAMNARAASLGMTGTHFNNPPGFQHEAYGPELGEHYSTAYDMALLSRAVLENPLARQVSEGIFRMITRTIFYEGDYLIFPWTIVNFFPGMDLPNATGIKGGFTDAAQTTGLFAVKPGASAAGDVIATTFTTFENSPQYVSDAVNLMNLGFAECSTPLLIGPWTRKPLRMMRANLPTAETSRWGASAEIPREVEGDLVFDVFRQHGQGPANARVELHRTTEAMLGPDQFLPIGVAPFQRHLGIRIFNMGEGPATLQSQSSLSGLPVDWTIPPGEAITIPAESDSGPREPAYQLVLRNHDPMGTMAHLSIEEQYRFELNDLPGAQADPVYTVRLARHEMLTNEGVSILYLGRDATGADSELSLALHEESITVGVGDTPPHRDAPAIRFLGALPNPVLSHARIAFELARSARIGAAVYDLQGRMVREFDEEDLPPGRHSLEWDGTGTAGNRLANGIYFVSLRIGGQSAARGKLVLSR